VVIHSNDVISMNFRLEH